MNVVLLIIILAVLVLSHEFGHFLFAKLFKMKVEEFGMGLPPRIKGIMKNGTIYSINWIPFGGFVRILGEDAVGEEAVAQGAFATKSRLAQALVVVAGILFNVLLAIFLMWFGFFAVGLPVSTADYTTYSKSISNTQTVIAGIIPGSEAEKAGLVVGSNLVEISSGESDLINPLPEDVSTFAKEHIGKSVNIKFSDGTEKVVVPSPVIGIQMDQVGILKLGPFDALVVGTTATFNLTYRTAQGIAGFLKDTFTGKGSLSGVIGPVGIAGLVGEASRQGFASLLFLTVILSITLAVVNCIPFPALDGGRLLFIIIEAIKGSPIKQKVSATVNAIGFALLLLLMVVVTVHDITKLF